jgi:hypothetical protein
VRSAMSTMFSKARPWIVTPAIAAMMNTAANSAQIAQPVTPRIIGMTRHLIITLQPSSWMAHMHRFAANSAIKTVSSKARLQPVFPVMLTQPSTWEHLAQTAPHAIILPIGIRQDSI